MSELRNALLARLQSLNLGVLHSFERYSTRTKELADCYQFEGRLQGGFLRRPAAKVLAGGSSGNRQRQSFELVLFRSWQDGDASQLLFDEQLDALMADFTNNHRLNGWSCVDGERLGFELVRNEPAMFAGVLVHYAVLRISFSR
ncbi:hypothetical protein [Rheinheimera maricola]|uniref:DUF3168 domain-containing protein n=1 Tax=Rheinheimera maricola TaxID=2793282 RepID=A0ABS7X9B5_9GAMM|nr:hypothetical protein [Rheinheimera maricola]MBZ9612143.1 hypothetical protein [Rheinheimera maricola]